MSKDIAVNMKFAGEMLAICNHFCKNTPHKCKFYHWHSYLEGEFIKTMCQKCALREIWGYNYKSTKGYRRWLDLHF